MATQYDRYSQKLRKLTPAQAQWQKAAYRSDAEVSFEALWRQISGLSTVWKPNYRFYQEREWKTDFAIPSILVAVEIEGFGHKVTARYNEDVLKYNTLAEEGWLLLRYTPQMLRDDPHGCISQVARVVTKRMIGGHS